MRPKQKQNVNNVAEVVTPDYGVSSDMVLPYKDAKELTTDPLNGLEEIQLKGKIALLPGDLQQPEVAVGHLLDTRLFYYLPAAEGILLAYRDLKVTCRLAATFCDRPFAHVVYSAKAVVFRPHIGRRLRGVVSQLSSIKRNITCVLCGVLNVLIPLNDSSSSATDATGSAKDAKHSEHQAAPHWKQSMAAYRAGDVIYFEMTNHTVAPNGAVSLVGRRCDVKDLANIMTTKTPVLSLSSATKSNSATRGQSTWIKTTPQAPQRICFDSSSSSSSSDSSDSASSSESESDESDADKPAANAKTPKQSQRNDNNNKSSALTTPPSSMMTPATVILSSTAANGRGDANDDSASSSKQKRKHLAEDNQNDYATPNKHQDRKEAGSAKTKSSSKAHAESPLKGYVVDSVAKLEPTTPSRTDLCSSSPTDAFDHKQGSIQRQLHQHQQQHERHKSAKKRKYLAD